MRRVSSLVFVLLSACGARSELRVPSARPDVISTDVPVLDSVTPDPDVPVVPACTWPPIGPAVELSNPMESNALQTVDARGDDIVAVWSDFVMRRAQGARVGTTGERLEDPRLLAGDLDVMPRSNVWLTRSATGGYLVADARFARVDPLGNAIAPARQVAGPEIFSPRVDTDPDRLRVIIRIGPTALGEGSIGPDGVPNVQFMLIFSAQPIVSVSPRAFRDDGSYALAWIERTAGGFRQRVQIVDPMNNLRGAGLSEDRLGDTDATVIATRDGYFVAWRDPVAVGVASFVVDVAALDLAGEVREAPHRIDVGTEDIESGTIGLAATDTDIVMSLGVRRDFVSRMALVALDELGGIRVQYFGEYRAAGASFLTATSTGLSLVFEALPTGNGNGTVYGMGFTCLR